LAANNRGRPQDPEHQPLFSLAYHTATFPLALCRGNSYTPGAASHTMMMILVSTVHANTELCKKKTNQAKLHNYTIKFNFSAQSRNLQAVKITD